MHEMAVMERILDVVVKHAQSNNVKKVVSISLSVGEMTDLIDEWMQKYFDYLSKGTVAENSKLKITRVPVVLQCGKCGNKFEVSVKDLDKARCPQCDEKDNFTLISGREYFINNMEAY